MSGVFENQDAAVVQMDFRCFPCWALVETVRIGIGWIPGTVEPVEVGFVIRDPFLELLGGCFLREAPEGAIGSDRRAGKWGLRGKRGRKRCFGVSVGGVSVRKIPSPRR